VKGDDAPEIVLFDGFQQPDLPGEAAGVCDLHTIARNELPVLRPLQIGLVVDSDDNYLVIGQELMLDRFTEGEAVKDSSEFRLIVPSKTAQAGADFSDTAPEVPF